MILTQTPFRISLGGGSTDIPSYYEKYGGFIFGVAIKCYMHIMIKPLRMDGRIQFNYRIQELVDSVDQLKHDIGREALRIVGIDKSISVTFNADSPAGTGLGSSGACAVGLLNGLYTLKGECKDTSFLAEKAFEITQRLGGLWAHDGKQDPYLAASGGFTVLYIKKDGTVDVSRPNFSENTVNKFLKHTLFFFTGEKREGPSQKILADQDNNKAYDLKEMTKEIGRAILQAFNAGDMDAFGKLMDEHWRLKKQMSNKISNEKFDLMYEIAKANGALGGKNIGAGGGGYFLFYCPDDESIRNVTEAMAMGGWPRIPLEIDYQGTVATEPDFQRLL
ncbi:MAG: D-glycero-alpha-D-manno-heptose-7-phosphate kinase [Parcubacteria group bacterium Gr01-1014_3]|nr:MAG: D-glycero-alpha-D-manno-heptose-7-phosphate kinase [Parcubacteria group bacterium Gr01-1014_3]